MTKAMVFLVTLMFLLPSHGSAQAGPNPRDRTGIRIQPSVDSGWRAYRPPSAGWRRVSDGAGVPIQGIEALETMLGGPMSGKHFAMTVAATTIVGGTIGGITWERCTFLCISPFETETRGKAIFNGSAIGAVVGALGGLIYSVVAG